MEIETTKLSKTAIETPNIKTNRLVAYDDILIRNSSLGKIFGSVEPNEERIDVRDLLSSIEGTSSGAEQIQAFRCDISNYTYDRFKSITIRKAPEDNSNGATSQQREVWMFVRCFDEYMNVVNDNNIISIDAVQQVSEETTWEFDPFILLPEYKILEFRITDNKENLNTNPNKFTNTIRSANIHRGNTKLEIKNWKTINQAKILENFTTDCYFELLRENTPFDGLMEGLNNAELNFNNHVRDNSIHLTEENLEDLTKIDTHINNNTIHVTQEEKDEWNNKLSSSSITHDISPDENTIPSTEAVYNEIQELISSTNEKFEKVKLDIHDDIRVVEPKIYDNSPDSTRIKSAQGIAKVQICGQHMIEGKAFIREAIIPQNTVALESEYYKDNPLYLVIYGDTTGNNTFSFVGTSNNTQTQSKGGPDMVFTFDDGINIGDYKKYRMFYARDISTTPSEPITSEELAAAPKMAFNALTLDSDCAIWQSNGVGASSFTFPIKIKYDQIEGEDLLHKDNTSAHLDEGQKEMLQSLPRLNDHISNEDIHLSQREREILFNPEFDYSNVNENDTLDNYTTYGFQLGNLHIKPGFIKEVRIPYSTYNVALNNFAGTFYLAVQIFKNGDSDTESDNKSLSETYFSENTHTISKVGVGEYTFTFNQLEIPHDFKFVRFMLTTSNEVVPNGYSVSNCVKMRVRPVKRNGTDYREFDIDDCKLITGTNGASQKFMAAAYFKYNSETKPFTPQKILSYKWRLETGNLNYETLNELCGALINTHNASLFISSQKYNIYNFNNDNGSGELDSTEKINFIIDIKYPNLMDIYEVIKTVHGASYENEHYPKIYPIF